eukprot:CAMPEP_0177316660 /NCGR_PEP_ID=MMETSP0368-20130122/13114_1 /TAXON_ID=447022 ORGANISM="Scrippsiella hangoei-like, Strain SHHI-4" /NCGR_SAMPLE_ID=MMETSP0368 /ASSEMBLY_ACC=CAM_ASM_000363 /LENGTH=97 /DNA_ID=CAMNT_0018775947 /DNA_START=103 /DNA_END=392 /DNA_ORIENTATION=-
MILLLIVALAMAELVYGQHEKCLEMLAEVSEKKDDYNKFWEQFGMCQKLGMHEDLTNRTTIASKPGDEQVSLKEHIDRMKEGRIDIYITGESTVAVS